MSLIFKTEGFVDNDKPSNYVSSSVFNIDKDISSLEFEFFGGGKHIFFHVIDPQGILRVQRMGADVPVKIILNRDAEKSCIGTIPGEIRKGEWHIKVYTFGAWTNRTMGRVLYDVKVYDQAENETASCDYVSWIGQAALSKGIVHLKDFEPENIDTVESKWLSGDFHAHTILSDGSASPSELIDEGISRNLDFFFITEHNILTTGFPERKGISVFPSFEVTLSRGHFNALGLCYMPESILEKGPDPSWKDLAPIIENFRNNRVLVSINHPFFVPWQWIYNDLPLSWIDSIELITDPHDRNLGDTNEKALKMIDHLWNEGYRITGIGGSDTHSGFSASQLGQPATRVFAKSGSLSSILEGVRKHRVVVSSDLEFDFTYSSGGTILLPGTEVKKGTDINLEITLTLKECSEIFNLRIIENGEPVEEKKIHSGEISSISRVWKGESEWIRGEIRDSLNQLRGYINPLHRGMRPGRIKTWGDAVELMGL